MLKCSCYKTFKELLLILLSILMMMFLTISMSFKALTLFLLKRLLYLLKPILKLLITIILSPMNANVSIISKIIVLELFLLFLVKLLILDISLKVNLMVLLSVMSTENLVYKNINTLIFIFALLLSLNLLKVLSLLPVEKLMSLLVIGYLFPLRLLF